MRLGKGGFLPIVLLAFLIVFPFQLRAEEASVGNLFIQAYQAKDKDKMTELMKTRTKEFPSEVKEMVGYAMSPGVSEGESDFLFHMASVMSEMYATQTKDSRLLNAVQMNYQKFMEKRQATSLPRDAVDKTKKELVELGKGKWRVTIFKLNSAGELDIEIDVNGSSGGSFTPRILMGTANAAKAIVVKNLPGKKGKMLWSSMGIGLKTAFIE